MEQQATNKNLKPCKACGKEMAKSAKACPHCGAKNKKPIFWIPYIEHTRHRENSAILNASGCPILPSGIYGFGILEKLNQFINFQFEDLPASLPEIKLEGETVSYSEFDSLQFLKENGVPMGEVSTAATEEDAVAVANYFGYPVVLKINSKDILHKSDIGGVVLNIKSEEEVRTAFNSIIKNATEKCPRAEIKGVLIEPMLKGGLEFIVGVNNDAQFGPMIMVGLGGVFVEIFKDVQLAPVPLSKNQAEEMVRKLKGFKLLDGYRGGKVYDIDALTDFIVSISEVASKQKHVIKELDINPLFIAEKGVEVADALLIAYK